MTDTDTTATTELPPLDQDVHDTADRIVRRYPVARSALLPLLHLVQSVQNHITDEGVVIIKAQRYRSQEKNREDSLARLRELIRSVAVVPKNRRPTKPTRSSQKQRLETKVKRGRTKALRKKVSE